MIMQHQLSQNTRLRTRWSAIGAAIAITLGAGGLSMAHAAVGSGERPVTVTVDAKRILDTRSNLGLSGRFADSTPRTVQVTGTVPVAPSGTALVVPADAVAVLVNVTVVGPSENGYLSLRAGDATGAPATSAVNFRAGSTEPNAATVDLSSDGKIQVWLETDTSTGNAHVLLDVVGYTVDHNHDDRYNTKAETQTMLGAKANATDVYTKAQVDAAVAAAGGVDYDGGAQVVNLPTSDTTVATVDLVAPKAGFVVITGTVELTVPDGDSGVCSLWLDGGILVSAAASAPGKNAYANTVGHSVTAGAHTVEMKCRSVNAAVIDLWAPWVTVTFSANRL